jgi:hypothetical protein
MLVCGMLLQDADVYAALIDVLLLQDSMIQVVSSAWACCFVGRRAAHCRHVPHALQMARAACLMVDAVVL